MRSVLVFAIYVLKNWKLSATPVKWLRDPHGSRDPPVGNRWTIDYRAKSKLHWVYTLMCCPQHFRMKWDKETDEECKLKKNMEVKWARNKEASYAYIYSSRLGSRFPELPNDPNPRPIIHRTPRGWAHLMLEIVYYCKRTNSICNCNLSNKKLHFNLHIFKYTF